MSNTIAVPAFGTPDSYARKIQQDPQHAVRLLQAVRRLDEYWDLAEPIPAGHDMLDMKDPSELNGIMLELGRLLKEASPLSDDQVKTTLAWLKSLGGAQLHTAPAGNAYVTFTVDEGNAGKVGVYRDYVRIHCLDGWGVDAVEFCNDDETGVSNGVGLVGASCETRGQTRELLRVLGAKFTEANS